MENAGRSRQAGGAIGMCEPPRRTAKCQYRSEKRVRDAFGTGVGGASGLGRGAAQPPHPLALPSATEFGSSSNKCNRAQPFVPPGSLRKPVREMSAARSHRLGKFAKFLGASAEDAIRQHSLTRIGPAANLGFANRQNPYFCWRSLNASTPPSITSVISFLISLASIAPAHLILPPDSVLLVR